MVKVIRIKETYPEIVEHDAEKFRDDLIELEENVQDDLTIDLDGIGQLNSIVVSSIIHCYSNMQKQGRVVSVVNAGKRNTRVFEMLSVPEIVR